MKKTSKKIDKQKLFVRAISAFLALIIVGGTLATLLQSGF